MPGSPAAQVDQTTGETRGNPGDGTTAPATPADAQTTPVAPPPTPTSTDAGSTNQGAPTADATGQPTAPAPARTSTTPATDQAAPASTGTSAQPATTPVPNAAATAVPTNPIDPATARPVAPDGTANVGALGQPGLAGVTGPQATAPTAPTAEAAPTAAPVPTPPAAAQVAMRIAPLRLDADGVHRLTVHLHPVDLGPVQVVAEIRNGDINLQLTGTTDAGTEALRDSLADLRRELEDSGFGNCTLDLRQGNPQQDQARQFAAAGYGAWGRRDAGPSGANGPAEPESAPTIRRAAPGSGRLDVQA
jgi:flagellar hook-length control protein FliK